MSDDTGGTVRRYDGGVEHADWCADPAHDGKCLDRLLDKIGAGEPFDPSEHRRGTGDFCRYDGEDWPCAAAQQSSRPS